MPEIQITTRSHFRLSEAFYGSANALGLEAAEYFTSIKESVHDGVVQRMRDGGGAGGDASERGNVTSVVIGGDNPALYVSGNLVQTHVDEYGLEANRAFPPWGVESSLWSWVALHLDVTPPAPKSGKRSKADEFDAQERHITSITFLVARAIYERGLPAPGDYLHAPFANTFAEFEPQVVERLQAIGYEVARAIQEGFV